jgi:hypothetical protein
MFAFISIVVYYLLAVYWIHRSIKNNTLSLTARQVALALAAKVFMGCLYGYIFLYIYEGDDTWLMHEFSLEQQELLLSDPWLFFTQLNPVPVFKHYRDLGTALFYYLSDLEAWLIAKPFAVINFLTFGNYYVNIVFYNAVVFWGHYWIFQLVAQKFPEKKWPLFIAVFFIPPVIFWLSGLRADGLILFFIALLLLQFQKWLLKRKVKNMLLCLLAVAGLVILRNAVVLIIVPALFAWWLIVRLNKRPLIAFVGVYGIVTLVFFGSAFFSPVRNLLSIVVNRQEKFLELDGNTRFELTKLTPETESFVKVLPQAFTNSFLRPYAWEAAGALQVATALEVILFWVLVAIFIVRPDPRWKQKITEPLMLGFLAFAGSLYLFTGYTVPFPGAIVRYKIIGELMFMVVFSCCIDWRFLLRRLSSAQIEEKEDRYN